MKYITLHVVLTLTALNLYSQENKIIKNAKLNIYGGMGIHYVTTPSLNDYLKSEIFHSNTDSVKTFTIGIEFFGGLEYNINRKFSVRLDYSYFFRSLSYKYIYFNYDYSYYLHQPYLMGNYKINYKNAQLNISAGFGVLFGKLKIENTPSSVASYTCYGTGFKGEILFTAKLSDNLSSYISGIAAANIMGKLKDSNGNILKSTQEHTEAGLNSFGIGLRFGLRYSIF